MPYDLGVLGSFGKDREADLPTRRIGAELVQVIEGLRFEGMVRGRIPGDFYGVCYLCKSVLVRAVGVAGRGRSRGVGF